MYQASRSELGRLAQDLQLKRKQVESVVALLDDGNTVPFIARFRKEQTDNLSEDLIRDIHHRVVQLRQLAERRDTVLRTIESQGKLTDELRGSIESAATPKRLEDLYLPYKPKKQTLATIARDRGLGNLADAIWNNDETVANLEEIINGVLDPEKQLNTAEDVLSGVQHILAERIAENAEVRDAAREWVWAGKLATSRSAQAPSQDPAPTAGVAAAQKADRDAEFRNYFDYSEPVRSVPPHRTMAINRGERIGVLKVKLEVERDRIENAINEKLPTADHAHGEFLKRCAADAVDRLILRSIEREVRAELTERAEHHAVGVFARNLRNLLLQPPVANKRVMAVDPGFRTGCKFAVLDEIGNLLEHGIIYPHSRRKRKKKKKKAESHASEQPSNKAGPKRRTNQAAAPDQQTAPESAAAPAANVRAKPDAQPTSQSDQQKPGDPPVLPADSFYRSISDDDEPIPLEPPDANEDVSTDAEAAPTPSGEAASGETSSPKTEDAKPESVDTGLADYSSDELTKAGGREIVSSEVEPSTDVESAAVRFETPLPPAASPDESLTVTPEPTAQKAVALSQVSIVSSEPQSAAKGPQLSKREQAKKLFVELCKSHRVDVIAIGNGSACRETEEFVSDVIREELLDVSYVIVNESGASVYSTSAIGREEFPHFDPTLRSTISIGRRLQDPLSEMVKIEPQNIGVGLYQHDVNPRLLKESLSEVVESCVNYVGVDVNTASVPLLQYVSGLNQLRAKNLVEHRTANGPFKNREQLKDVPGIGPAVFTQAAGFLKTSGGDQPFDRTWIHPESYSLAEKILGLLGCQCDVLNDREAMQNVRDRLAELNPEDVAQQVDAGAPTARDIIANLARPDRDPREDLPPPIFKRGILKLEDLSEGMELKGTVLNVVDFGAFVDIGLKDSCLVHISELADRFIRVPHDVVSVGDIVTTWVLKVDKERRRVSLTMIPPDARRTGRPPKQSSQRRGAQHPAQQNEPTQKRREKTAHGEAGHRQRTRPPKQAHKGRREGAPARPKKKSAPRRPPKPLPKLSSDALEGKETLHTFGELKAFFEHQKKKPDEPKSKG